MSLFDIAEAQTVAEAKPARRANAGVRFVLKFVDGSSVTVDDRPGIIGVKPVQDSDQVFRICVEDDTDTVAPEHLEFGVENGVFWVQDLKTVTGTMVAEPEAPVIQCIPYEKYFLVRGSRVNIGEVTFTLH
jgi:pSer/pThr/pTyr-binding forkhead associated (FHA) protein